MTDVVLDASAVLAWLQEEPSGDMVRHASRASGARPLLTSVNLGEVVSRLADGAMQEADIRHAIATTGIEIVPFDEELAYSAGLLRPVTRNAGLSFGDRACLALGARLGATVITLDRAWLRAGLNLDIVLARSE